MRGYIKVNVDGSVNIVTAQQGGTMTTDFAQDDLPLPYFENRLYGRVVTDALSSGVGLYRIGGSSTNRRLGRSIADAITEADRLSGLGRGNASTASPGISGYQHMENMANARLANTHRENGRLAEWLRSSK